MSYTLSTEIHRTILTTTDFYMLHDTQPADMVCLHMLQTYTSLAIVANFYCKECLKVFSVFQFLLIWRLNLLFPMRFSLCTLFLPLGLLSSNTATVGT